MAKSMNGWPVYRSSKGLAPLRWITGRVKPGNVYTILGYLGKRFNDEVEKITPSHSWGYAYRPVRGQVSGFSNHASATAVDFNAPRHPLGRRGTFNRTQETRIHEILRDLDSVVRWGGDYQNRADEMHFEINDTSAAVAAVARKIRKDTIVKKSRPKPVQDSIEGLVVDRDRLIAHRKTLKKTSVQRARVTLAIRRIRRALKVLRKINKR